MDIPLNSMFVWVTIKYTKKKFLHVHAGKTVKISSDYKYWYTADNDWGQTSRHNEWLKWPKIYFTIDYTKHTPTCDISGH